MGSSAREVGDRAERLMHNGVNCLGAHRFSRGRYEQALCQPKEFRPLLTPRLDHLSQSFTKGNDALRPPLPQDLELA